MFHSTIQRSFKSANSIWIDSSKNQRRFCSRQIMVLSFFLECHCLFKLLRLYWRYLSTISYATASLLTKALCLCLMIPASFTSQQSSCFIILFYIMDWIFNFTVGETSCHSKQLIPWSNSKSYNGNCRFCLIKD